MSEERSIYYVLTTYDKGKPSKLLRQGDTGYYAHDSSSQSNRKEYTDLKLVKEDMINILKENIRRLEEGYFPSNLIEPHFEERCWQDDYEYSDNCG